MDNHPCLFLGQIKNNLINLDLIEIIHILLEDNDSNLETPLETPMGAWLGGWFSDVNGWSQVILLNIK